jgi:hypothetical protein
VRFPFILLRLPFFSCFGPQYVNAVVNSPRRFWRPDTAETMLRIAQPKGNTRLYLPACGAPPSCSAMLILLFLPSAEGPEIRNTHETRAHHELAVAPRQGTSNIERLEHLLEFGLLLFEVVCPEVLVRVKHAGITDAFVECGHETRRSSGAFADLP